MIDSISATWYYLAPVQGLMYQARTRHVLSNYIILYQA